MVWLEPELLLPKKRFDVASEPSLGSILKQDIARVIHMSLKKRASLGRIIKAKIKDREEATDQCRNN